MPKIQVMTWIEERTGCRRMTIKFWPKTLSTRIVRGLWREAGYPVQGDYNFDWNGNIKRIEEEDA